MSFRLHLLLYVLLALELQAFTLPIHQAKSSSRFSSIGDLCGIQYDEPLFRPPAEWRSLILQVTLGCSWNKCTFCEMYQEKSFQARPIEDIIDELDRVKTIVGSKYVRDVFLADGDAMTLPTGALEKILDVINEKLPRVRRISSYCLPRNIRGKSVESLSRLRDKGLSLVYVGCESGDDTVLSAVQKGETFDTSLDALTKLKEAGMKRSVMILIGLGGKALSSQHALQSAALCSVAQPEYLSLLTVSFPRGKSRVMEGYNIIGNKPDQSNPFSFEELSVTETLEEIKEFLTAVDIPRDGKTIFRSDHASNYLVLKGRLGRDKDKLLLELESVLDGDDSNIRPEWLRGL